MILSNEELNQENSVIRETRALQIGLSGRMSLPASNVVSMAAPIGCTAMSLTSDKRPVSSSHVALSFTPNEAFQKSENILKALWGDLVEGGRPK